MSAPIALPLPRYMAEPMSAATAVSKANPNIKYLLTMVKGQNRPPENEMRFVGERHARDEDVPVIWEAVGIYDTKGAAEAVVQWSNRQASAHPRDRYQISPFVENAILPRARIHLADDEESPPACEYEVVEKAKLEELIRVMRGG